jgi:hypothetical protein
MQCSHLAAAACVVTLLGSTAVSAQAPPSTPRTPAAREAAEQPMKPFWRLFERQRSEGGAPVRIALPPPSDFARPNSSRRFICSTPVLPADAGIDRRIHLPEADTKWRFTMPTIQPVCH